jgi:hypothetical protein
VTNDADDGDTTAAVAAIHEHLAATEELPLETAANRWIGEAQAVVEDVHYNDATAEVVRDRTRKVVDLLEHVDGTGDPEADEHVATALEHARDLIATLE